jgi:hypothetical protein
MHVHTDIRILTWTNSNWSVAKRAVGSDSIMFALIISRTLVSINLEMFLAKGEFAVVAFER